MTTWLFVAFKLKSRFYYFSYGYSPLLIKLERGFIKIIWGLYQNRFGTIIIDEEIGEQTLFNYQHYSISLSTMELDNNISHQILVKIEPPQKWSSLNKKYYQNRFTTDRSVNVHTKLNLKSYIIV